MFSKKILFLSLLVVGVLFTGCQKEPKSSLKDEDEQTYPAPVVSFNMSGADALGGRDVKAGRFAYGSRAVDNSNNSSLVKILEDGTLESALSADVKDIPDLDEDYKEHTTIYGKLTDVFLPPKGSKCSDIYLLFDSNTTFPAYVPDENCYGTWGMGPLLAIHEDGSWTDILIDSPWLPAIFPIDDKRSIQIAPDGSLSVLFRDAGGYEYYIRKYDPSTKTVKEICRFGRPAPYGEETETWTDEDWANVNLYVSKMKISKDGKWAYIQVRMAEKTQYIHVVSLDNPSIYNDVILEKRNSGYAEGYWDYDEKSNKLYYLEVKRGSDDSVISKIIYSADPDGKNPKEFKTLGKNEICYALDAVAKDTIWLRSGLSHTEEFYYSVFRDVSTGSEIKMPVTYGLNCLDDYIVKDDAIYLCYGGDLEKINGYYYYTKNEIIRVSIPDGKYIKYSENLTEGQNITIKSWNVGDSKIYITGEAKGQPVNYSINIDGKSRAQKIAEGQVFTCIGSLK